MDTTADYISKNNSTQTVDGENSNLNITPTFLHFPIPGGAIFLSLICLMIWNITKPLFS